MRTIKGYTFPTGTTDGQAEDYFRSIRPYLGQIGQAKGVDMWWFVDHPDRHYLVRPAYPWEMIVGACKPALEGRQWYSVIRRVGNRAMPPLQFMWKITSAECPESSAKILWRGGMKFEAKRAPNFYRDLQWWILKQQLVYPFIVLAHKLAFTFPGGFRY